MYSLLYILQLSVPRSYMFLSPHLSVILLPSTPSQPVHVDTTQGHDQHELNTYTYVATQACDSCTIPIGTCTEILPPTLNSSFSLKGGRTPPTQFFVDGCYARLLLLYSYRGFSTTTQGQSTCRRSRSLILERIWRKYRGLVIKTL